MQELEQNPMLTNESEKKDSGIPSQNPSQNATEVNKNEIKQTKETKVNKGKKEKKEKEIKSKEERLKEGINILTKLKETGVTQDESFDELKKVISSWVNTGEYWNGSVAFPQYGKVVTGHLPKYKGQAPVMVFKLI